MTAYERFALNQYLSDYPSSFTYQEVVDYLIEHDGSEWRDDVTVWQPFADYYRGELVDLIDTLRQCLEDTFTPKNTEA